MLRGPLAAPRAPAAPRAAPLRAARLAARADKGFGGGAAGAAAKGAAAEKKSRRGKAASRPDPARQLEALKAEERAYREQIAARQGGSGGAAPAAPASSPPPSPAAPRVVPPPTLRASSSASTSTSYAREAPLDPGAPAVVPADITDRMLRRMVAFGLTPVALGCAALPGFWYLKKVLEWDVPTWAAYIVVSAAFGGGLVGISYGVLSSSWEAGREGSAGGWDEFRANLPALLERFKR
jgi:hypothetical protein